MHPTTFLFFAFGPNLNNHTMANFSILSLKKFAPANSNFVFYTDRPEYYNFLSPIVETRLLDEKKINEWQGPHKFLWRIKIMAMLDSAQKDAGHLVYLDTDTFALSDLSSMIAKLDSGSCFMHVKEKLLSKDKAENKKLMWKQTRNKQFGGMLVDQHSAMWNAGVVAINEKNKIELITKALQSTDQMCEQNIERWLIEQFSLSLALSSSGKLEACDQWIAHYWGNKEMVIRNIQSLFSSALMQSIPLDQLISSTDFSSWRKPIINTSKKSFLDKWLKKI